MLIKQSDLNAMTRTQLESLLKKVKKTLDNRSSDVQKAKAIALASKIAKKFGFTLDELTAAVEAPKRGKGKRRDARIGRKVPPKYRNPEDKTQTWSGRGNKPRWVLAALERGSTMDDLKIG